MGRGGVFRQAVTIRPNRSSGVLQSLKNSSNSAWEMIGFMKISLPLSDARIVKLLKTNPDSPLLLVPYWRLSSKTPYKHAKSIFFEAKES
jgi:hypothetical protein